jgi:hypothetical protein
VSDQDGLRMTRIPSLTDFQFEANVGNTSTPFFEGFYILITGAVTNAGATVARVTVSTVFEFIPD